MGVCRLKEFCKHIGGLNSPRICESFLFRNCLNLELNIPLFSPVLLNFDWNCMASSPSHRVNRVKFFDDDLPDLETGDGFGKVY